MTTLNCNNEDEDDDNGDDGEKGNSDDMTGYRLFQIHRPLAGHFVTMVVRLGRVKLPCVVAIYSPPSPPPLSSPSSKNNQHLTIPYPILLTIHCKPGSVDKILIWSKRWFQNGRVCAAFEVHLCKLRVLRPLKSSVMTFMLYAI